MATTTRSALHTPLCDRLGIRYPICQAGMAFVVVAAAHGTAADLRDEIRRVRDLTDRPFGGQSAGLIRDVRPVARVVASIVEEAEAIRHRLGARGGP